MLVQGGDEHGVAVVEKAISLDAEAEQSGAELLFEFYRGRKDLAGMDRWHARLDQLPGRAPGTSRAHEVRAEGSAAATASRRDLAKLAAVIAEQRKVKRGSSGSTEAPAEGAGPPAAVLLECA
jgi:hypothetical protein